MKNLIPPLFVFAFAATSSHARSTGQCLECGSVVASPAHSFPGFDFQESAGHTIYPVTQPTLAFSDSHRAVQISGVAMAEGKLVPAAMVEVIVELEGGFVNAQTLIADKRGFYTTRVQAPARMTAVKVTVESFCSVKGGCAPMTLGAGAGAIAN